MIEAEELQHAKWTVALNEAIKTAIAGDVPTAMVVADLQLLANFFDVKAPADQPISANALEALLSAIESGLTSGAPAPTGHLFEGAPDGRQAMHPDMRPSRFRSRYRALTGAEIALHDEIKAKAAELEALFDQVKAGRYSALGMTALEQAVMWTVKGLTS
jgi:hypothetical protein